MSDSFEYDVFLSHSSADKQAVRELAGRLRTDGLRVWFDEWVNAYSLASFAVVLSWGARCLCYTIWGKGGSYLAHDWETQIVVVALLAARGKSHANRDLR